MVEQNGLCVLSRACFVTAPEIAIGEPMEKEEAAQGEQ
jgi:hypothetical protein